MYDVFVVDDEVWVTKLISNLIDWDALGFRVVGCYHDGMDAVEEMKRQHPHLVLTDIKMPGMSGLALMEEARKSNLDTNFVVISGHNDFEYVKTALTCGALGYLLKPIDENELLEILGKAKDVILRSVQEKEHHLRMEETLGRTLEQARSGFFASLFSGERIGKVETLQQINENLKLSLTEGVYRVIVMNTPEEKDGVLALREAFVVQKLMEVAIETVIFMQEYELICIVNYAPELEEALSDRLDAALDAFVRTKGMGQPTAGLGIQVPELLKCAVSYQTAREATTFRWTQGPGRIYKGMAPAANEESAISAVCTVQTELNLRTAIGDGNLPLLLRLMNDIFSQAMLRVEKNPRMISLGAEWLLALFQDVLMSQTANTDEAKKYIAEKKRGLVACQSMDEVRAVFASIAERAMDNSPQTDGSKDHCKAMVWEAVRYVDHNFMHDISLAEAAEVARLNPNYFCTLFREEVRMTFKEYLTQKRMDAAKKFLKNSKYRLNEIADIVGYHDVKHFSNVFKKTVGITPGEYRKVVLGHE